jgi:hypothetical protein
MALRTFTFYQQDDTFQNFVPDKLEADYRGWRYSKLPENQLYFIVPPENKRLPPQLGSLFTTVQMMQRSIDSYLEKHPNALNELEDMPVSEQRKQHRSKIELLERELKILRKEEEEKKRQANESHG